VLCNQSKYKEMMINSVNKNNKISSKIVILEKLNKIGNKNVNSISYSIKNTDNIKKL
jgi:hypothetical protein